MKKKLILIIAVLTALTLIIGCVAQTKALGEGINGMSKISEQEMNHMIDLAKEARTFAYAPYSEYKVGACLRSCDGKYFTGCNVENASYGVTNCAERTAIFKAVSEGAKEFDAIVVVGSGSDPAYPCGACRQVLSEFAGEDMTIILLENDTTPVITTLGELMPHSFNKGNLE